LVVLDAKCDAGTGDLRLGPADTHICALGEEDTDVDVTDSADVKYNN
jgi:hypothetical protein